jgi:hypothetical protein
MILLGGLAGVAGLVGEAVPARADVLVENISQSTGESTVGLSYSASYAQFGAQEFMTGSQGATLGTVSVLLGGSSYTGTVVAELLSDNGNPTSPEPGSTVRATFTTTTPDSSLGNTPIVVTFTPTSSYTLSANSSYWFAIGTTSTSTGSVNWADFSNPTSTGSGSLPDDYVLGGAGTGSGGNWSGIWTGSEFSISISSSGAQIDAVPEPATLSGACLGSLFLVLARRRSRRGRTAA